MFWVYYKFAINFAFTVEAIVRFSCFIPLAEAWRQPFTWLDLLTLIPFILFLLRILLILVILHLLLTHIILLIILVILRRHILLKRHDRIDVTQLDDLHILRPEILREGHGQKVCNLALDFKLLHLDPQSLPAG